MVVAKLSWTLIWIDKLYLQNAESLEDLCVLSYLKQLETEMVSYISLTQSKSVLLKGVARRMLQVTGLYSLYPSLPYSLAIFIFFTFNLSIKKKDKLSKGPK